MAFNLIIFVCEVLLSIKRIAFDGRFVDAKKLLTFGTTAHETIL